MSNMKQHTNADATDQTDNPALDPAVNEAVSNTAPSMDDYRRLEDEVSAANDRVLRAQAELENFRKRMRREIDEERRYAALPLIGELLPVIDNLDRAIEAGEQGGTSDKLLEGVKMVRAQFLSALERHHCRRLGQVGEVFDPNRHQAIAQEPSDEHPVGVVTRIARYGMQLHERVVRPAEVLVSMGKVSSSK